MRNSIILLVLGLAMVGVLFVGVGRVIDNGDVAGGHAVLHKSSTCGCCAVYGDYLGKIGYDVEVHNTENLVDIKTTHGVPSSLASCHTMEIGGYVVEGHIPEEAIRALLEQGPDIKGIGMAGMPSGSPGMPGPKTDDFVIYEITHEGERGAVFMTL